MYIKSKITKVRCSKLAKLYTMRTLERYKKDSEDEIGEYELTYSEVARRLWSGQGVQLERDRLYFEIVQKLQRVIKADPLKGYNFRSSIELSPRELSVPMDNRGSIYCQHALTKLFERYDNGSPARYLNLETPQGNNIEYCYLHRLYDNNSEEDIAQYIEKHKLPAPDERTADLILDEIEGSGLEFFCAYTDNLANKPNGRVLLYLPAGRDDYFVIREYDASIPTRSGARRGDYSNLVRNKLSFISSFDKLTPDWAKTVLTKLSALADDREQIGRRARLLERTITPDYLSLRIVDGDCPVENIGKDLLPVNSQEEYEAYTREAEDLRITLMPDNARKIGKLVEKLDKGLKLTKFSDLL